MEEVTVTILEREYRLSCAPDEREALLNAVGYVDEKMTSIRNQGKVRGVDRIAVFAALNIAHELLTALAEKKMFGGIAFGEFRPKIESMKAMMDEVLHPQDQLL